MPSTRRTFDLASKCKELGYDYKFFGLVFHSNLSLPWIASESNLLGRWDVALHLGVSPYAQREGNSLHEELTYVSSDTNEKGESTLQIWKVQHGAFVRMIYEDGTQFWMDHRHENIWTTWPDHLPLENAIRYLLGPVLGLLLRLRGVTCLHASAVAIEGWAVLFVGSAGAGKSTTAAAFARNANRILSDDIVALEEKGTDFYAFPAYPHLCLWPDSVNSLYGSPEALPRFLPDWDKRRLALDEEGRFEGRALPVAAIYILGDRRPDPPHVESVAPQGALISLVTETYANKVLDRELRSQEFDVLGRLAVTIPIRRIFPNCAADRVGDLCRVIEDDLAALRDSTQKGP